MLLFRGFGMCVLVLVTCGEAQSQTALKRALASKQVKVSVVDGVQVRTRSLPPAFDDKGARDLPFIGPIRLGPDVYESRSVTLGYESLVRSEADQSAPRFLQKLVDAASARMNHRYPLVVRVFNGKSHPLYQRTRR